jgi:hypothetical protein
MNHQAMSEAAELTTSPVRGGRCRRLQLDAVAFAVRLDVGLAEDDEEVATAALEVARPVQVGVMRARRTGMRPRR